MKISRKVLIIASLLLLTTWILGNFFFQAGKYIHIFLIVAAIFCMQAVIINPKPQPQS